MITIQNTFDAEGSYPLARLGDPASLLFFDIETTGFSGDFCTVYLIGCVATYCQSAVMVRLAQREIGRAHV